MAWTIRLDPRAQKDLSRLDRGVQSKILRYLETRVALTDNPETLGKALVGSMSGLWRYRVEDYRIVCRIQHEQITVLVLAAGHRKHVYKRFS